MKVLVTGGLGYIGSHTCVALAAAGHQIVIVDDLSNSLESVQDMLHQICGKTIPVYPFNILETSKLRALLEEEEIEAVIHFAGFLQVKESVIEPIKYYRNNVEGCISVLEAIHAYKDIPLVFSSSCTVYGSPDNLPVAETAPIKKAESPYGQTKIICEQLIEDMCFQKHLRAINLRYFNPIGAHPSALIGELQFGEPHHLVPYITETAKGKRKTLSVFGADYNTKDGTCIRDYIHVMDLAEAHVKAIETCSAWGIGKHEAINIGTGKGSTVLELIQAFESATNVEVPYQIEERRAGDVAAVYAKADKAKSMLGWTAKRSLEQALKDAWNWEIN